ncbi:MAG TPA: hypothetical protein VGV92_01355 [Gammaproteobacteria bacterium]|nr:hypothetical protein [Gammaproteobacteria bacterium]
MEEVEGKSKAGDLTPGKPIPLYDVDGTLTAEGVFKEDVIKQMKDDEHTNPTLFTSYREGPFKAEKGKTTRVEVIEHLAAQGITVARVVTIDEPKYLALHPNAPLGELYEKYMKPAEQIVIQIRELDENNPAKKSGRRKLRELRCERDIALEPGMEGLPEMYAQIKALHVEIAALETQVAELETQIAKLKKEPEQSESTVAAVAELEKEANSLADKINKAGLVERDNKQGVSQGEKNEIFKLMVDAHPNASYVFCDDVAVNLDLIREKFKEGQGINIELRLVPGTLGSAIGSKFGSLTDLIKKNPEDIKAYLEHLDSYLDYLPPEMKFAEWENILDQLNTKYSPSFYDKTINDQNTTDEIRDRARENKVKAQARVALLKNEAVRQQYKLLGDNGLALLGDNGILNKKNLTDYLKGKYPAEQLKILENMFRYIKVNPAKAYGMGKLQEKVKGALNSEYSNKQYADIKVLQEQYLKIVKTHQLESGVNEGVKTSHLLDFEPRDFYINPLNPVTNARKRAITMYVDANDADVVLAQLFKVVEAGQDPFEKKAGFLGAVSHRILDPSKKVGMLSTGAIVDYMLKHPEHIEFLLPQIKDRKDFVFPLECHFELSQMAQKLAVDIGHFNIWSFGTQYFSQYSPEQWEEVQLIFLALSTKSEEAFNANLHLGNFLEKYPVLLARAKADAEKLTAEPAQQTPESAPQTAQPTVNQEAFNAVYESVKANVEKENPDTVIHHTQLKDPSGQTLFDAAVNKGNAKVARWSMSQMDIPDAEALAKLQALLLSETSAKEAAKPSEKKPPESGNAAAVTKAWQEQVNLAEAKQAEPKQAEVKHAAPTEQASITPEGSLSTSSRDIAEGIEDYAQEVGEEAQQKLMYEGGPSWDNFWKAMGGEVTLEKLDHVCKELKMGDLRGRQLERTFALTFFYDGLGKNISSTLSDAEKMRRQTIFEGKIKKVGAFLRNETRIKQCEKVDHFFELAKKSDVTQDALQAAYNKIRKYDISVFATYMALYQTKNQKPADFMAELKKMDPNAESKVKDAPPAYLEKLKRFAPIVYATIEKYIPSQTQIYEPVKRAKNPEMFEKGDESKNWQRYWIFFNKADGQKNYDAGHVAAAKKLGIEVTNLGELTLRENEGYEDYKERFMHEAKVQPSAEEAGLDAFFKADDEKSPLPKLSDFEDPEKFNEMRLQALVPRYEIMRKAFATGNYDAAVDVLMELSASIFKVLGEEGGDKFLDAMITIAEKANPNYFDYMMVTELSNVVPMLGGNGEAYCLTVLSGALTHLDAKNKTSTKPASQLYQLRESTEGKESERQQEFYFLGRDNPLDPLVQRLIGNDKLDMLLKNISFLNPGTLSTILSKFPSPAEKLAVLEKIFKAVAEQQYELNKIAQGYKNLVGSPYSNEQQKDIKLLQKAALDIIKNNPADPRVKAHVKESALLNAETRDIYLNVPGHTSGARKRVMTIYVKLQDADAVLSQMSALFEATQGIISAIKRRMLTGLLSTQGIVNYMFENPEHIQSLLPLVKGRRGFSAAMLPEQGNALLAVMKGMPEEFNAAQFRAQHSYSDDKLKGLRDLFLEMRRGEDNTNILKNFHGLITPKVAPKVDVTETEMDAYLRELDDKVKHANEVVHAVTEPTPEEPKAKQKILLQPVWKTELIKELESLKNSEVKRLFKAILDEHKKLPSPATKEALKSLVEAINVNDLSKVEVLCKKDPLLEKMYARAEAHLAEDRHGLHK